MIGADGSVITQTGTASSLGTDVAYSLHQLQVCEYCVTVASDDKNWSRLSISGVRGQGGWVEQYHLQARGRGADQYGCQAKTLNAASGHAVAEILGKTY